jgi:signal transduction histidine kinase
VISWNFATQQDAAFVAKSRQLVDAALRGRLQALSSTAMDYAFWNDAHANIVAGWNPEWIEANYYSSAADGILIFTEDGAQRYAWFSDGAPPQVRAAAATLIRGAGSRAALREAARASTSVQSVASGLTTAGDQLVAVAAAPISIEEQGQRAARPDPEAMFAVSIDVLDESDLEQIGRLVGVEGLMFQPGPVQSHAALTQQALVSGEGDLIGALAWRNARPGSAGFLDQVWLSLAYLALLGIAATFTARALVKNQISASARADAERDANRSKSEIVALIGNDLRAPLNAILSNARQLQRRFHGGDAAPAADAGRIINAARWMLNMIDKLVDESQLDSGHLQPAAERVSAERVLEGAIDVVSRAAGERGVSVRGFADADVDEALADRLRLTQALVNVVWTAVRLPGCTGVEILVSRKRINEQNCVAFTVNAVGAALDDAGADALLGAATAASRKDPANLAFTRKLARAMSGDLTIAIVPDIGAALTLTAPEAPRLLDVASVA